MHDKIHKPKQKTRDFDTELVNQVVRILLSNNTELTGFLLDATRFWLKVKTKEKSSGCPCPIILASFNDFGYCGCFGHGLPPHPFLGLHLVGGVQGYHVTTKPHISG